MRFIIYAGCSLESIEEAIQADSYTEANEYAATIASESFHNYSSYFEGQVETDLSNYDLDEDSLEYREEYDNMLFNYECDDIYYEAEEFDYDNAEHLEILENQNGEFREI